MLRYTTDRARPGSVAFFEIRPGNRAGLFLQPRNPHRLDVQSSSQFVTINKSTSSFSTAVCPSCHPTNSVKALHEHLKRVHNQNEVADTCKHPRNESNNTGFLDSKFSPIFGHFPTSVQNSRHFQVHEVSLTNGHPGTIPA